MSDLSKILLGGTLTQTERLYLVNMAHHDGFPVLKKIFDEACKYVIDQSVQCDPEAEDYERVVKYRQQRARIVNDFCAAIQKSFNANVMIANDTKEKDNDRPNSRPETN